MSSSSVDSSENAVCRPGVPDSACAHRARTSAPVFGNDAPAAAPVTNSVHAAPSFVASQANERGGQRRTRRPSAARRGTARTGPRSGTGTAARAPPRAPTRRRRPRRARTDPESADTSRTIAMPSIEIGSRARNAAAENAGPPRTSSRTRYGFCTPENLAGRMGTVSPRAGRPDAADVRRRPAGLVRRTAGSRRRAAVPAERHARSRRAARAAGRGRRALPAVRRREPRSTRRTPRCWTRCARRSPTTGSTCRSTGATATGTPTSSTPWRRWPPTGSGARSRS